MTRSIASLVALALPLAACSSSPEQTDANARAIATIATAVTTAAIDAATSRGGELPLSNGSRIVWHIEPPASKPASAPSAP